MDDGLSMRSSKGWWLGRRKGKYRCFREESERAEEERGRWQRSWREGISRRSRRGQASKSL